MGVKNILIIAMFAVSCVTSSQNINPIQEDYLREGVFFEDPERITASSDADYFPEVSEDGMDILYVADRLGNKDIWIKPGNRGLPIRLTNHVADDFRPVLSPDGTQMAFVSRRDDALGDIYIMDLEPSVNGRLMSSSKENPMVRIFNPDSEDSSPTWSPDGKNIVFAARRSGTEDSEIMQYDVATRKISDFGNLFGAQCSVAPDGKSMAFVRGGALYIYEFRTTKIRKISGSFGNIDGQPRFGKKSDELVFIRYIDDTNRDGKIDAEDRATLWRLRGQFHPTDGKETLLIPEVISSARFGGYSPVRAGKSIYAAMETSDGINIYRLPEDGHVKLPDLVRDLDDALFDIDNDDDELFLLRKFQYYYRTHERDDRKAGIIALRELRKYLSLERFAEARIKIAEMKANFPGDKSLILLVDLASLALDIQRHQYPFLDRALSTGEKDRNGKIKKRVEEILSFAEKRPDLSEEDRNRVKVSGLTLLAQMAASERKFVESDHWMDLASKVPHNDNEIMGIAQLFRAMLTKDLVGDDASMLLLIGVARQHKGQKLVLQVAIRYLTKLASEGESSGDLFRKIFDRGFDIPLLAAGIHMNYAEGLRGLKKDAVYSNELRQIVDKYRHDPSVRLKAAQRLSEMMERNGDYHGAGVMWDSLSKSFLPLDGRFFGQLKVALEEFRLRYSYVLLTAGKWADARTQCETALKIQSSSLNAKRCLIDASFRLNGIEEILEQYERNIAGRSATAADHYLLGYALTYRVDAAQGESKRIEALEKVIVALEKARDLDSQIPQVHQTLGWAYFQLGHWKKMLENKGGLKEIVRKKWSLLSGVFGFGESDAIEDSVDSFDAAYFLSTKGSTERAVIAQNLGQSFYELESFQKSLDYFLERIAKLDVLPIADKRVEGALLRWAGRAAFHVEKLELAAKLQEAALSAWQKIGIDQETAYSLDALALTHMEMGHWSDAAALYARLLRLDERLGYQENRLSTLTNLGYCAFSAKKFDQALAYFDQAAILVSELEKSVLPDGGPVKKSGNVIALDIAGEQSNAKGFDLFSRRNLLLSFKSLIHEQMGRLDLAADDIREKIALLELEDARRSEVTGKKNTLIDARIIANSRLGALASKIGEEKAGSDSYSRASDLARNNRPKTQRFAGPSEIASEVSRARLKLRMLSLGLIGEAEAQEEVVRIKGIIRDLQSDGGPSMVERTPWVFDLTTNGRSLEGTRVSGSQSEFLGLLRKELDRIKSVEKQNLVDRQRLATARQLMPEIDRELGFLSKFEEDNNISVPVSSLEAFGVEGFSNLTTSGEVDRAWDLIEKTIRSGSVTRSPVERLAVRHLWETFQTQKIARKNISEILGSWRGFLAVKYTDLLRRGGILPNKKIGIDLAKGNGSDDFGFPDYLTHSLGNIQESLSDNAAILMAHRNLDGRLNLGFISREKIDFWEEKIAVVGEDALRAVLSQSHLGKELALVKTLYIVPDSELFDTQWEKVVQNAVPGGERIAISFIPSPDILPRLMKRRLNPRDRVAFIGQQEISDEPSQKVKAWGSIDNRKAPVEDLTSSVENFRDDEALHLSIPIYINDVEPHLSSMGHTPKGASSENVKVVPPSLLDICKASLQPKAFIVFSEVIRSTTDYRRNIDAHDGWAYALLCSLHYGTPTILWNETQPVRQDGGVSGQNNTEKQIYWADFYENISKRSLLDTVLSSQFSGRVLGDLGLGSIDETRIARESYESIFEEAEDFDDEGQLDKSKDMYRKALFLGRIAGRPDQSELLTRLVGNFFKLRDFRSAYFYQRKKIDQIRSMSKETHEESLGDALVDTAVLAVRSEKYDEGKDLLNTAENFYISKFNFKMLGKIDQYRAINAENQGSYDEAIRWYESSRAHYLKGDEDEAAQRLLNIGNIYNSRLANLPKALEYYEKALEYFREEGDVEAQIKVLIDISNALIAIGDLGQATAILESQVLARINKEENVDTWIRAQQMLANAYLRRGQFDHAQKLCADIIDSAVRVQATKDLEKRDRRLIDAFGLRAYLLAAQGFFKEAFVEFDSTIAKAMERNLYQQAAILFNNYGFWLREVGNLEKSLKMIENAEAIDTKLKSRSGIAVDRRNLGLTLIAMGDLSRSKDLLEQSLDESKKLFLTYNIAYCHFGLGDIALRENKLSEGDWHFREALALAQKGMMPDLEWRALGALGRVAQLQGRNKEAILAFRQAIGRLEEREGGLRSEASRNALQSDSGTQEIYAYFAKVLMDEGEITEAWETAERARSRAYLDAIGTRSVDLARQRSRDLKAGEKSARLEMEQSLLANRISPDSRDLRSRAEAATRRYLSVLDQIEKTDSQLLDLVRVKKVSFASFTKKVPRNVAVVSYFVTPSHLLIWLIKNGEIIGHQVEIRGDKLERMAGDYRAMFENLSPTEFLGRELAEALLVPLLKTLAGSEHIILIPHRALHFLPFAALPVDSGYLTDVAPLSYVESARVASYLLTRPDRVRVGRKDKLIALFDPIRANDPHPRLSYTVREVEAMRRFYPNVVPLKGAKASEDALRGGTGSYQVLHIGSHGEYNADYPASSRLLLSESDSSDGNLDVVDILELPDQADHVTLSACESGRGSLGSGDDVVSLDRAFFYAGARTVVSSLWRISDVTSAVTIKRYYRYLSEGDGPSKAMQKAQAVVRRYFRHPAYWASFRVIGDGL